MKSLDCTTRAGLPGPHLDERPHPVRTGTRAGTTESRQGSSVCPGLPGRRPGDRARLWQLVAAIGIWLPTLPLLLAKSTAGSLEHREWTVQGVTREALIHAPSPDPTDPAPLVFAFHGHGGSARQAARSFRLHECWPEAIVVYPQGLPTPGRLADPQGRMAGWQSAVGQLGDRDLAFFDTMLEGLATEHAVNRNRVHATGHSNGGWFTYLLWEARSDQLAAVAPSAAALPGARSLKPKPVLHVAGRNDGLVRFAWQERTINALRRLGQCDAGRPWEEEPGCTLYPSPIGGPVVTFIHAGGHRYPSEAPAIIVKFFQQHALP